MEAAALPQAATRRVRVLQDYGPQASKVLEAVKEASVSCGDHSLSTPQQKQQQQQQSVSATEHSSLPSKAATLGVLKLTPEKGCSIVLALAQHLQACRFLVVTGDPKVAALFAPLPNVEVREGSAYWVIL